MSTPSAIITTLIASALLSTSACGQTKLSACPPVIGERDMMLVSVSNVGTQKRFGELCKVPGTTIQLKTSASIGKFRPCLAELGVKEIEIDAALKSGAPLADDTFARTDDKELLCAKTRAEFGQ